MTALNERQRQALHRILEEFDGKLSASKWKVLAKCSLPTTQRELKNLLGQGMLVRHPGGSTNTDCSMPGGEQEVVPYLVGTLRDFSYPCEYAPVAPAQAILASLRSRPTG